MTRLNPACRAGRVFSISSVFLLFMFSTLFVVPAGAQNTQLLSAPADLTNQLAQINNQIAALTAERSQLGNQVRESHAAVWEKSQTVKSDDKDIVAIRQRMGELEKELFNLRQELQQRMAANPELKGLLDGQHASVARLNQIQIELKELYDRRDALESRIRSLPPAENATADPAVAPKP